MVLRFPIIMFEIGFGLVVIHFHKFQYLGLKGYRGLQLFYIRPLYTAVIEVKKCHV